MTAAHAAAALRLPGLVARQLLDHARAELPNEACGLLSGDGATATVTAYHPARNEHASPYRYSLDARDLVRITFAIEATGSQLLGIFHSHPNAAARPSATDIREARYPEAIHLLAGFVDGSRADAQLRAWHIDAEGAREVSFELQQDVGGTSGTLRR
jgi:proteasome lid subunit RPN8/RPN11